MKIRTLALLFVLAAAAFGQQREDLPSDREYDRRQRQAAAMDNQTAPVLHPKLDLQKIRSEADELAKLAQAVPPQIDQAGHGALPKDLGQNLKQIEKLTKHLRRELNL